MRSVFLATAAALSVAAGTAYAQPNPPEPERSSLFQPSRSASELKALSQDWDRIGFNPPSKPSQYRVYGREGHLTNGPGYNAMVALIRSAARDVRAGYEQEALIKIAKVRRLLGEGVS